MLVQRIPPKAVELFTPDFLQVASGFGCAFSRRSSVEQLAHELKSSMTRDCPTFIELHPNSPFLKTLFAIQTSTFEDQEPIHGS